MPGISRRTLLGTGASALAASALGTPGSLPSSVTARKPKNIIFMVADGMAHQTLSLADHYQQEVLGRRSYWRWLANQDFVTNGLQETRSLSSVVTDSAAASSAWGSGRRIWNGQLNEFPDGTKLRTLQSLFREHGCRTGMVTTTTITHATPAGFAVCCDSREKEWLIAQRYLEGGFDVLMGGGNRHFAPDKRKDKLDLYAKFASSGYLVAKNRDEVLGAKSTKILGVFADGHLPYTVDRDNDPSIQQKVPTLAEMVRVALKNLKGSRNGFVLQVEGGKVDHAAHGNDAAGMLWEQIAFEEAVKVAVEFALNDGETLVVVTSDHATGGPSLNGVGDEYFDSTAALRSLAGHRASYEVVYRDLGSKPDAAKVQDVLLARLEVRATPEQAKAVSEAFAGSSPLKLSTFHGNRGGTLATALSNHTAVGWTSQNHTAEHVMVTALGPGSHKFGGSRANHSYFDTLLGFKDIRHANPKMAFEEARVHAAKRAEDPHDLDARLPFEVHG